MLSAQENWKRIINAGNPYRDPKSGQFTDAPFSKKMTDKGSNRKKIDEAKKGKSGSSSNIIPKSQRKEYMGKFSEMNSEQLREEINKDLKRVDEKREATPQEKKESLQKSIRQAELDTATAKEKGQGYGFPESRMRDLMKRYDEEHKK